MAKKDDTAKNKAQKIAEIIQEKKALDIVILDISKDSTLCDYFVICSGDTRTQVKAIFDAIRRTCKKEKITIHHAETGDDSRWIFLDFFDVILHIFLQEAREFYDLEHLYRNAKEVKIKK